MLVWTMLPPGQKDSGRSSYFFVHTYKYRPFEDKTTWQGLSINELNIGPEKNNAKVLAHFKWRLVGYCPHMVEPLKEQGWNIQKQKKNILKRI